MNAPPLYNRIAKTYNRTRSADPYLVDRMTALLDIREGNTYLDIGCGTGNYTTALASRGGHWIGMDPSDEMLDNAKARSKMVDWRIGRADDTGLDHQSVDGVIASLTIHHWPDLLPAFAELARLLRPDGCLVLFTATPEQMKGYWLRHYFPQMMVDSMARMPAFSTVEAALYHAGLTVTMTEAYEVHPELEDHFLYCGKHMPEIYLEPEIRAGISSFSVLANQVEVRQGLSALEADVRSGRIWEIIAGSTHPFGDYLFIQAKPIGS